MVHPRAPGEECNEATIPVSGYAYDLIGSKLDLLSS